MPADPPPDAEYKAEMSQLLREFGRNARAIREGLNLSQEEFARMIGVHRTQISATERGEREPRLAMILTLARGLGVSPDELAKGLHAPIHRRPRTR